MSTNYQNSVVGALLHKIEAHCPNCHTEVNHWFKDLDNWKYTKKEAVKVCRDDFVKLYCPNIDCGNVFAVKPRIMKIQWEYYNRVENEGEEE